MGDLDEQSQAGSSPLPDDEEEKVNQRVSQVLVGSLVDPPAIASRICRIFTSSTFTDTTTERNALMATVYPRLKVYCREKHGMEFQVVDMRWGVRDEATDDHMTTELCMREIATCQAVSIGPNFIVFLGQKYGYRPIPTIILGSEFELLLDVIKSVPEDARLLTTWYKVDSNSVPSVYILQPISSILINFNNKRVQKLMEQDQNTWWEVMGKLQIMLRKAAQVLMMARKIDREQMHNYFMSVTEREVRHGILYPDAALTKVHTLAYVREIKDMNLSLVRSARNFIDMVGRGVDHEAMKLLSTLRDEKLVAKMIPENIVKFTVDWSGNDGINAETHADYIKQFCDHFYANVIRLVDDDVIRNQKLSDDPVYSEVLQHLHVCNRITQIFLGREEEMNHIKDYILGDVRQPLTLYGESGSGKTAVLAKAYANTFEWLKGKKPVMLLRFLGTSPDSSSVIPLLKSLSHQICINFDQPREDIPDDLSPLITHFKKLMALSNEEKPIVLCLDSLDQISATDGGHTLSWMPMNLTKHSKVLVSTETNQNNIRENMRRVVLFDNLYLEIAPLGEELAIEVLKSWLANQKRTVSDAQMAIARKALSKCNLPLFVKLVFDEMCRWKSYSPLKHTTLAADTHASIMKLLDRVENQHGKILVMHSLGYLTSAKSGLSEAELEDLLSLDERVLNDVYQYHLPPTRRIPPLLWTRIRSDLPGYLSEREADGVNVINWYHGQFIDASRERYFRNVNFLREVHSNVADYFLGIWGGKPKPFEYSELQRQRFFLTETKGESDRKVPEQPLYYTDVMGKVTRYNLRKLAELPFHLIRSQRIEELYKEVLFNFRWLHSKLSCMPLTSVLSDYEDTMELQFDKNIKILTDTLRLSASVLSRHPDMVGPQIVGRLLPYYQGNDEIRFLIQQCDTEGLLVNALVPYYHCMHTPGGPLQYSLEGHPFAPFGTKVTSNGKYLVSVSNLFILWDLETGDMFRSIIPGIQGIMQNLAISPDDKTAVAYTNNNQILVCFLVTGEFNSIQLHTDPNEKMVGLIVNNTDFTAYSTHEWYRYTFSGQAMGKGFIEKKTGVQMHMDITSKLERFVVVKVDHALEGVESETDMTLKVTDNNECEDFDFHSAISFSKDKSTIYACIALSDDAVTCYKRDANVWKYDRTLGDNYDKIFSLVLSPDEHYLVGTVALGYKLWDLRTDRMLDLKLPDDGARNVPSRNLLWSLIVFTKNMQFVVAAVRKNIYVWDVKVGNMVKILDAHFGRVICLVSVPSLNKVISASMDKTIKVWNFDNILEDVHSIHRHDKPIEAIDLAANEYIGATTTRNCVGIWNLENGKLIKTLANSAHSSIVTHACISADARIVVSSESGHILIWDVAKGKVLHSDPQRDVQQMFLWSKDSKVTVFSKLSALRAKCVTRSVPEGETLFTFEYNMRKFRNAVLTCDNTALIVSGFEKQAEILSVFNTKNGNKLYDVPLKYNEYLELTHLVAMPHDSNQVAVIDPEKGNILDLKKKHLIRSVKKWNGDVTQNGKLGLFAPIRGGMELLELKGGKTKYVLIPRVAEGVHAVRTGFTKTDTHLFYYHTGRRSIRVFRVSDGKQIADYAAHAEITAIATTQGGAAIVLGAVDGSVVVLAIADPKSEHSKMFLQSLPSRQESSDDLIDDGGRGSSTPQTFMGLAQVARAVGKARQAQKSRACSIS